MKHILCFGDSNTWGYTPGSGVRYGEHTRWTGVLQDLLGEGFRVHEDGLNARTTVYDSPYKPFLNGLPALQMALVSQKPLDALVLSLGTNDLKEHTAAQSANGLIRLIRTAQTFDLLYPGAEPVFRGERPRILVVSPIAIGETATGDLGLHRGEAANFPWAYAAACTECGVPMLDAQRIAAPSRTDGVHMDADNHRALAAAVHQTLLTLLED